MGANKFVIFQAGNEQYGIPVQNVVSIEKIGELTVIPHMPEYMLGVVRIRGELVPVLDTMKIFYHHSCEQTERTRMIVVITEDLSVGLIVDDAKEIIDIPSESIKQVNLLAYQRAHYFVGVASLPERLITLVDPNQLFESLDGVQSIKEHIQSHQ